MATAEQLLYMRNWNLTHILQGQYGSRPIYIPPPVNDICVLEGGPSDIALSFLERKLEVSFVFPSALFYLS
jgi:hypothetical protein